MYAALKMSSSFGPQSKYREINGRSLYIETYGSLSATPVILLHHGLGTTRAWKEQIPALLREGYCVIAYDRWGYGLSQPRNCPITPEFFDDIDDLRVLVEKVYSSPLMLIGHSDGGTIASYFAASYPDQVACLISVASHIYVEPKMETGIRGVKSIFQKDERFREGLFRVHGEKYEQVFYNWYEGWLNPDNLRWDMREHLHKIISPTLIIQGNEDEHATPQHAQDMAASISKAELWLVQGVGHMFPQDQPEMFNQRIVSFLEQKCSAKS
jgi:pimeloyl-ACP methyl ester carboxylesterase